MAWVVCCVRRALGPSTTTCSAIPVQSSLRVVWNLHRTSSVLSSGSPWRAARPHGYVNGRVRRKGALWPGGPTCLRNSLDVHSKVGSCIPNTKGLGLLIAWSGLLRRPTCGSDCGRASELGCECGVCRARASERAAQRESEALRTGYQRKCGTAGSRGFRRVVVGSLDSHVGARHTDRIDPPIEAAMEIADATPKPMRTSFVW